MKNTCGIRAFLALGAIVIPAFASTVVIQKSGTTWQLLKDGQPYYVNGAGGGAYPDKLLAAGGNSIRTWSPDKGTLDNAQSRGMTVCLGISGNDYNSALASVQAYKSHPALLMWGLGNEMESSVSDQVALWKMVDSIARMVHQIDGQHPCITALADIGGTKLQSIMQNAPNLDAVGINTYSGLSTLKTRVTQTGWTKPYFVTEFGPVGWWECSKTAWGVPIEQTSTEKESTYVVNYQKSIQGNAQCLGGYVFLWGNKQEKTHTWFGMFLPTADGGNPVGTVDGMQFVWTGAYPANQCPRIGAGKIKVGRVDAFGDGSVRYFRPGVQLLCTVDASDPDNDSTIVTWDLRVDVSNNTATGGAYEPPSTPIAGAVLSSSGKSATIQLPADTGIYRVFCYVKDPKGSAATANCPIVVQTNAPEPVGNLIPSPLAFGSPISVTNAVRGKTAIVTVYLDRETFLSLEAYSGSGKLVSVIDKGAFGSGPHAFAWKAGGLSCGTYCLRLLANGRTVTKKIILQ